MDNTMRQAIRHQADNAKNKFKRLVTNVRRSDDSSAGDTEVNIDGNSRKSFPVRLAASADASEGISIVAFDVTLNGKRYGEWFDALAIICLPYPKK